MIMGVNVSDGFWYRLTGFWYRYPELNGRKMVVVASHCPSKLNCGLPLFNH